LTNNGRLTNKVKILPEIVDRLTNKNYQFWLHGLTVTHQNKVCHILFCVADWRKVCGELHKNCWRVRSCESF